tara:strand:+ start:356 stop:1471 length:1116 start_codon:yes stop_codon:yes gene_type:complete
MKKNIKFSDVDIRSSDLKVVNKILKSGWLTHGKFTNKFQEEFRKFTNSKFALTVSSCTAALHISCLAAGFKNGDEVILPAVSHTATSHAIEYCGAKPIFVDVEKLSGNIDIKKVEKKITNKTKGIIIVHMAGYACDIKNILRICKKHNLKLIEDCAHSIGTIYNKKHVGNFGETGCFSFYPTKQITTGEGGMVITNNKKVYNKLKKLKAFGIDKDIKDRKIPGQYDVKILGYNFRMTDFQAAIGYFQIKRYKENLRLRKKLAKYYNFYLKKKKDLEFLEFDKNCSYFVFQIFIRPRNKVLQVLKKNKIGCSIHYLNPIPNFTFYKKKYGLVKKNFFNAFDYGKRNISLPNHPKLSKKDIKKICETINTCFQ